jgi:hypothetical protein
VFGGVAGGAGACAAGDCADGACAAGAEGCVEGAAAAGGWLVGACAEGGAGVAGEDAAGGVAGLVAAGGVVGDAAGVGVPEAGGVCDCAGTGISQSTASAATAILAPNRFGWLATGAIRLSIGKNSFVVRPGSACPEKHALDLIGGGNRFFDKDMRCFKSLNLQGERLFVP